MLIHWVNRDLVSMPSDSMSAFQVSLFVFYIGARYLRLRAVFIFLNPASLIRAYIRIYKSVALLVKYIGPG
jgi:hypothetical protein